MLGNSIAIFLTGSAKTKLLVSANSALKKAKFLWGKDLKPKQINPKTVTIKTIVKQKSGSFLKDPRVAQKQYLAFFKKMKKGFKNRFFKILQSPFNPPKGVFQPITYIIHQHTPWSRIF